MTRVELFEKARSGCHSLFEQYGVSALNSVIVQLDCLIALEQGERKDAERLNDVMIGIITVREIEPHGEGVPNLLYQVEEQVEQMKTEHSV